MDPPGRGAWPGGAGSLNLTGAEVVAIFAASLFAGTIGFAYFLDRLGLPIAPFVVLPFSLLAAVGTLIWAARRAVWRYGEIAALLGVIVAVTGWLVWLLWPRLLPPGESTDLTHHLQLVDYIERNWRLPHDAALEAYLGEMLHYTPGSQLLAALAGAWTGSDGFHAFYPVVAVSVGIKAGFVFLIAMRLLPRDVPQIPLALASVALLLLPQWYFVGSILSQSYFAQVVSELFAVVMWWALVMWDERPSTGAIALFAIAGASTFLTWPLWIGPPALTFAAIVAVRGGLTMAGRVRVLLLAGVPLALLFLIYSIGQFGWMLIVRSGADTQPLLLSDFGWPFLLISAAGLIVAAAVRRGRATVVFVAAIALQAAVLYALAKSNDASTPYMAIKMAHLAIYPLAATAALALGIAWQSVRHRRSGAIAWGLATILVIAAARQNGRPERLSVVSEDLYQAGRWARGTVDAACVDYVTGHELTAYWLHLAVLGNRRMSERTADKATFRSRDAIVRWIEPGGLPYAIADLAVLPRDVREESDELARFGSAIVIKRRNAGSCR
jgi:hypothetical protein